MICFPRLQAEENSLRSLAPLLDYLTEMANHHRKNPTEPIPIVAIGGCPGVGKTYLNQLIFQELQQKSVRCAILPLDDFVLSPEEFMKLGVESDQNHRWFKRDALHACLSLIHSNVRLLETPTRDQRTQEVGLRMLDLSECDLLFFEGSYALCTREPLHFFIYAKAGIFIEASAEDIYQWKWEREQTRVVPRTAEKFAKSMEIVFSDFNQHIAYSKENARFVIRKDHLHRYTLEVNEPLDKTVLNLTFLLL
ncbi:MAG: hypothetical protein ACHQUC_00880 [Chlamydiales bacterium]